jgi:ankyrin repeat protein
MNKTNTVFSKNLIKFDILSDIVTQIVELKSSSSNDISKYFQKLEDTDVPLESLKKINKLYFNSDNQNIIQTSVSIYNNCISNNLVVVEKLLNENYCETDIFGNTLLFYAGVNGLYEMVILLLNHGLKVNHRDCFGRTVLHKVARTGNQYMINLLLHYDADQHIEDIYERYPIVVAFIYKKDLVIEEFLNCGFKVHLSLNMNNLSILHIASLYDSEKIINTILRYKFKNVYINDQMKDNGFTPLHLAYLFRKENSIKGLINNGASLDITDKNGRSVRYYQKK